VSVISSKTNTVATTLIHFNNPQGIAYDPVDNQTYIANHANSTITVINAQGGSHVTNIHTNIDSKPVSLAFDAADGDMFIGTGTSAFVDVVNSLSNTVVARLFIGSGPLQLGYDSANSEMYVVEAGSTFVKTFDGGLNEVTLISLAGKSLGLSFDPSNTNMYITMPSLNSIVPSIS